MRSTVVPTLTNGSRNPPTCQGKGDRFKQVVGLFHRQFFSQCTGVLRWVDPKQTPVHFLPQTPPREIYSTLIQ